MSSEDGSTSKHICSLYYGKEHFLVKTVHFLKQGLKNEEKVFLYVEDELKEEILEILDEKYQDSSQLEFIFELDLAEVYLQFGKERLKEKLKVFSAGRFNKARVLYQISKSLKEADQNSVLELEEIMNEVLEDSNLFVLCMYDATDLIEDDNSSLWLKKAVNCHQSLLSADEYLELTKDELAV
ncbi:MEDS domain-containing protein [Natroniella sp. ANB-PHB2]|uniref:MEDS domain-containing protein n=1 Tax=Natroniella sp. ANB-PHB2 TaxID=3384444 RepID=UPI0038D3A60E